MNDITNKAIAAKTEIEKKMKTMETIHLFYLTERWSNLRVQKQLLECLLNENVTGETINEKINQFL